jgi:hypothetical protein
MGFFDESEPCPHLNPPLICRASVQLRDALDRLDRIANMITIVPSVRNTDARLHLLRRVYALADGLREVKPS